MFRDVFEEERTYAEELDAHVLGVAIWILYAGRLVYRSAAQEEGEQGGTSQDETLLAPVWEDIHWRAVVLLKREV